MAKKVLFEIEVDSNFEELNKFEESLRMLKKQRQDLVKLAKSEAGLSEQQSKQLTAINEQIKIQSDESRKLSKEIRSNTKEKNNLIDAYQIESKKLNDLRKELKNKLLSDQANSKSTRKLAKEVDKLDKRLKDVDAAAGQFQRNVGNYPQKMKLATKEVLKLAAATVTLEQGFEALKSGIQENEEGSEAVRTITSGLGNAYDKAKESAANYALGLWDVGKALWNGASASEAWEQGTERMTKGTEALTNITKAYEEGVELEQKVIDQEKAFLSLDRAIGKLNAQLGVQEAIAGDTTRSFDDMEKAAKEALATQEERDKLVIERAESELSIIKARIDAKTLEGEPERNLIALKQEQVELENALDEAYTQQKVNRINGEKEIAEIQRDKFEQELDFALDVADRQKTVNERIIADTTLEFEFRKDLADKTSELMESSYASQIQLTEDFITKRQKSLGKSEEEIAEILAKVNVETLANLEDEKEVRKRLIDAGIADQNVQNRIREIIIERKAAVQDLKDVYRDLAEEEKERLQAQIDRVRSEEEAEFELLKITKEYEIEKIKDLETSVQKRKELIALMTSFEMEQIMNSEASEKEKSDRILALKQKELLEIQKLELQAEKEKDKKEEERLQAKKEFAIQVAQETSDAIFQVQSENLDRQNQYAIDQLSIRDQREQDILQSRLESGLISQAEFENNRIALAEKIEEDRLKIERNAFEKKKKLDTAQAIINGALAITKILAQTGVAAPFAIPAAVASTAIQVATIQAQKFAKGGLINGASHEQGGVPAIVDGKRPIEVEGGEAIINKKSVAMFKDQLNYINQAGGGVPLFEKGGYIPKFANGGLASSSGGLTSIDLDRLGNNIIEGINSKKVINIASETVNTYSNAQQIENEFTL